MQLGNACVRATAFLAKLNVCHIKSSSSVEALGATDCVLQKFLSIVQCLVYTVYLNAWAVRN